MRRIWKRKKRSLDTSSTNSPGDLATLIAKGPREMICTLCSLLALASGCALPGTGHSSGGYGALAIWDESAKVSAASGVQNLHFPPSPTGDPIKPVAKLAVAQLGEPLPEPWMMDPFVASKHFASVEPCPGGGHFQMPKFPRSTTRPTTQEKAIRSEGFVINYVAQIQGALEVARLAARDRGCDYLLVVIYHSSAHEGGSVIPLIDILLFPLYVIPNEKAEANATGVALLINTAAGQMVRRWKGEADATRIGTYINLPHAIPMAMTQAQNRLGERMAKGICGASSEFK